MIDCTGESDVWYFYHLDGLGSVVALSNTSGTIVETYSYDVFGAPTITLDGSTDNPYMFTARRYDDETDLYYYRARMYAPDLGRFLQPDPIGYDDGMNMYTYVGNNPTTFVDPSGLLTGADRGRYRQLSEYTNSAAQALAANIETLEKSYAGEKRVRRWYMGVLVADTSVSAISAAKSGLNITRGVKNLRGATSGSFRGNPFPGKGGYDYGKAMLGERRLLGEIEGAVKGSGPGVLLGGIAVLPLLEKPANYILDLIDIGKARRKAVGKYDPFIQQALINIDTLSENASWALQEMKALNSKGCDR